MGCPCGGAYEWNETLEVLVCIKCGRHSGYQRVPTYEEVLNENILLRKMLEDICECHDDFAEKKSKARELLGNASHKR